MQCDSDPNEGGDMKKSFLEVCVALLEPTLGILTSGSLEKI